MYYSVCHFAHCAKGKKGKRQFPYHLFSCLAGMKTNMLLIIVLGLIAKLASVSDGCDVGTQEVTNFDWSQVRTIVLTRFLKEAAFITAARLSLSLHSAFCSLFK